ncbi:MAG: DUF2019 domain-containing protein [Alphaproteobacteria bacterium]|nr:DUF2019 domain-containing protein [Alphaproteobacteria bacterium]
MIKDELRSKTPEQLFTLFWEAARKGHFALGPAEYNRSVDRIHAIVAEIKSRTPDARHLLLPLLQDKIETVRYVAATHLLEIDAARAVAVLTDLRENGKTDVASFAYLDLDEWQNTKSADGAQAPEP